MDFKVKVAKGLHRFTDSVSTKYFINKRIGEYGQVVELKIDSKNKSVYASVQLKGENSPIKLEVENYEITKSDLSTSVLIRDVSSDKPWLDAVVKNFLVGKPIDVPVGMIKYLDGFLG
jgi:hypothetical protein